MAEIDDDFGEGAGICSIEGMGGDDAGGGDPFAQPGAAPVAGQMPLQVQGGAGYAQHPQAHAAWAGAPLASPGVGMGGAVGAASVAGGAPAPGGMVVQTLDGPKYLSPVVVGAEGTAAPAVKEVPPRRSIDVTYTLCSSLADLASGAAEPVLALPPGCTDCLDSGSQTVLYNATVVAVNNQFPVAWHVDVNGIEGGKVVTSSMADSGHGKMTKGTFLVHAEANSTLGTAGTQILDGRGDMVDQMAFRTQFPKYSLANIEHGITWFEDARGKHATVEFGHPVIAYFNGRRAAKGERELGPDNLVTHTNSFNADAGAVHACLDEICDRLRGTTADLGKVNLKLSRVFGDFGDDASAPAMDDRSEMDGKYASSATRDRAMTTPKRLSITIRYDYRPE